MCGLLFTLKSKMFRFFFIVIKYHLLITVFLLSFMFFVLYLRKHCETQGHWDIPFIIFYEFYNFGNYNEITYVDIFFVYSMWYGSIFFCMCPSATCWQDCLFFNKLFDIFFRNQWPCICNSISGVLILLHCIVLLSFC